VKSTHPKDQEKFTLKQWDDFHDDGSEDGVYLGEYATVEEAEDILFAFARRTFSTHQYSGDPMISWTISGPGCQKSYRLEDYPALADPLKPEDEKIIRQVLSEIYK